MPVWQILTPVDMCRHHLADRPIADQFRCLAQGRMETELESHQDRAAGAPGSHGQLIQPGERIRDRLFE